MAYDLFVSYRRIDQGRVRALVDLLKRHGLNVFFDQTSIDAFQSSTRAIEDGLAHARAMLLWYSAAYPASRPCQWEMTSGYLLAQRLGSPRERVLVANPEPDNGHINPIDLRDQNYLANLNGEADLERAARELTRHLAQLDQRTLSEGTAASRPLWYGKSPLTSNRFVGRLTDLWRVHSALLSSDYGIVADENVAIAQIRGLAGVGKTLLAEEYALRFGSAFPAGVFWITAPGPTAAGGYPPRAQREAMLRNQLQMVAVELGLQLDPLTTSHALTVAIRSKLDELMASGTGAGSRPFLWVVDDMPVGVPRDELEGWLAPHPLGKTLLTTRSREHDAFGGIVDVDILDPHDSFALLTHGRAPQGPDETRAALGLCDDVGHHPMALDLMGAALQRARGLLSFVQYRTRLARSDNDVLELAAKLVGELPSGHETSIAKTLLESIDGLEPEAIDLLGLAAHLAPAPIPAVLIARAFALADSLDEASSEDRAMIAFQSAASRCLADPGSEDGQGTWRIHALVGRTIRFKDPANERRSLLCFATVNALNEVLPQVVDARNHRQMALFVAHGRQLASQGMASIAIAELTGWLARFDLEGGAYLSSLEFASTYVALREQLHGLNSAETLLALGDQARSLQALGRFKQAQALGERIVAARTALLGPENLDTLTAVNNLATTLSATDLTRSIELHRYVKDVRSRILGVEHEHTLFSAHNLGAVLLSAGRMDEARTLLQLALDGRRRLLGPDHPDTLTALRTLAMFHYGNGEMKEAEELTRQVVEGRTRVLGASHPRTIGAVAQWGRLLIALGANARASTILAEARRAALQVLGEDHSDTVVITNNLGRALANLDDWASARPMFEKAAAGSRRLYGERGELTTRCAFNLFELHTRTGEHLCAKKVFEQSLAWLFDPESTLSSEQRRDRDKLAALGADTDVEKPRSPTTRP